MKCPYNGFKECIIEKCPSCNYETITKTVLEGRKPSYMNDDMAVKEGLLWESNRISYKFISCKLIENNVQPTVKQDVIINNNNRTNVSVRRSVF